MGENATKSILFITRGRSNRILLQSQIEELLGDQVDVRGYCVDEKVSPFLYKSDLIVLSTESIFKFLPSDFEQKCTSEVIVARRAINFSYIYRLFNLAPKQKVMLVNDRKETAEEVISLLYGMGFEHLWLIPVYPGLPNPPRVNLAITPGESHLVPSYVDEVIDIGTRKIDLSTMVEILLKFDLLDEKAHLLSARYMSSIVELSHKLSESFHTNKNLVHLLEAIIQRINNGVIATDSQGKIVICNKTAEAMFNVKRDNVIGMDADQVLPNLGINKPLQTGLSDENIDRTFREKHILLNRIPLEYDGKVNGAVLTSYEFSQVERIERKLRKHVYSKGHVARYTFKDLQGNSPRLLKQINNAKKFAPLDMTVLILGETGTGKELMAHAIHNASTRKNGPFVAINCAALPKDLLESELFGFEEGTFTGARRGGKPGLFEQAHLGTIFLDEIGEIPPDIQAKLLRAIEEKEVMRIGGDGLITIDVRVIAATNRELKDLVSEKKFREDLYYRLNVLKIDIPPLRQRKTDIMPLMDNMLSEYDKRVTDFIAEEARDCLTEYSWPGNIRELKNVSDFLVATVIERRVLKTDLPGDVLSDSKPPTRIENPSVHSVHLQEDIAILRLLSEFAKYGQGLGRRRLKELMDEAGIVTTEDKIRTRMKVLESNQLIEVSKGRAGSTITEKGIALVQSLDK
jgi:transcriptional regulator with PAS, ATPase and Fis domain